MRWNFDKIEPKVEGWLQEAQSKIDSLPQALLRGKELTAQSNIQIPLIIGWLEQICELINSLEGLLSQLSSYAGCRYSAETGNAQWVSLLNRIESMTVPLSGLETQFVQILATIFVTTKLPQNSQGVQKLLNQVNKESILHELAYFLEKNLEIAQHRMTPEMEELASDLQQNAGSAWDRLQSTIMSELSIEWSFVGHKKKSMVDLRNLAYHENRHIRKRAYNLELGLWEKNKSVFASALNGVKGNSITLYERRNYKGFLDPSIQLTNISAKTLNSLISAMEESLPMFHRYLKLKARYLGLNILSFYDIFAPISQGGKTYTYDEAQSFIVQQFANFSEDLAHFAEKAFLEGWIDAEPRLGKVGGAFMTDFPLTSESRILSNFDGSFNSITTLAHELGHAYHSFKLEGLLYINRNYPMTLAETASIFCETIVCNAALKTSSGNEKLSIIEGSLVGTTQVVVDILSRFYFEQEIFKRRKKGEISAEEFCEIMIQSQKKTYGDGLNEAELHPYMWAVKGHYYNTDFAFYNYPYTFGLLFALSLYARYMENPRTFPELYSKILRNTGIMSAVDLCAEEGFDIESIDFWRDGLKTIESQIETFSLGTSE